MSAAPAKASQPPSSLPRSSTSGISRNASSASPSRRPQPVASADLKSSSKTFIKFKVKGRRKVALFFALIAGTLLLLMGLIYFAVSVFRKNQTDRRRLNDELSKAKLTIAKLMESSLDHRISPCDNFYQHTCGNYRNALFDLGHLSIMFKANEENTELLLRGFKDRRALQTSNSRAVRYFIDVYEQCLRDTGSDSQCAYLYKGEGIAIFGGQLNRIYMDQLIAKRGLATVKKMRQIALDLVVHLRAAVKDILTQCDWLDESTRGAALEKLAAMRQLVAYDDELLDDAKLDAALAMDSAPALGADHKESSYLWQQHYYDKVYKVTFSWMHLDVLPLYVPNAEYGPRENALFLQMASLQEPIFDPDDPAAFHFGSIGFILGHEILHGFDNLGATFDKNGERHNWWSEESKRRFEERIKCLEEQYSSIVDPVTGQRLNGSNTIDEDIADNGGMSAAYAAFQKHLKEQHKSRALMDKSEFKQYTAQQLFFYAFAMTWCEAKDKKFRRDMLEYDVHTMEMYRVNVVLQNFKPFAETFNCRLGSAMNPKHKCRCW